MMKNISAMMTNTTPQKVVNKAINSAGRYPNKQHPQQHSDAGQYAGQSVSAETATVVNDLFSALQAIFPAWRYSYPTEQALSNAKKNWIKALMEAGIDSFEQIKLGLQRARASKSPYWPAAGVFVDWCKPSAEDLGMPIQEEAYREAINNLGNFATAKWSHAAVYEAVLATSWHVLRSFNEREARTRFYKHYAILVKRVINGEKINIPPQKAISDKAVFIKPSQEVEQQALDNIKRMVGLL